MKHIILLGGWLWLFAILPLQAQIVFWDFENICGPVPCLPVPASLQAGGVALAQADLVGGNNIGSPTACTGSETWATNFWPTAGAAQNEYLRFTVQALPGFFLDIQAFYFSSSASSASSALSYDAWYVVNGGTPVFLGAGVHAVGTCTGHAFFHPVEVPEGGTIEFRIYPYGQNPAAQAATIRLDDVWLEGTAPLPVELLYFEGRYESGRVLLEWATAQEEGHAWTTVERWTGADFRELGRVWGRGEPSRYRWEDPAPLPGENLYRLRQVDVSGKETLLPVVALQAGPQVRLRSNLISGGDLVLLLPLDKEVKLEIYDMQGRRCWRGRSGGGEVRIHAGSWPAGMYWLRWRAGDHSGKEALFKI